MRSVFGAIVALLILGSPLESHAFFHESQIGEVMSGVGGDPNTQFVEIRMLSAAQNFVQNTRLTFFGCGMGNPATVLLALGMDLSSGMPGGSWIMATTDPVGGIHTDFTFSPGIDNTCGMICWGAPVDAMTLMPPMDPSTWSATDPNNYVDCWAYGGYSGPTKAGTETFAGAAGDGTMSLTRSGTSIGLACPTPTNDAGDVGTFAGGCSSSTTTTTLPPAPPQCTDVQATASTRAMVGAQCSCAGATSHRAYVKCAAHVMKLAVKAGALPGACKGAVMRCAVHSTCGRAGSVTCCRTTAKGVQKCSVKKHAAACKSPKGGTACVGNVESCCDACGGATCPAPATTTTNTPTSSTLRHTTTTHTSGGGTTTSTTARMCVAGGGRCTTSAQCCSQYCYLGSCY